MRAHAYLVLALAVVLAAGSATTVAAQTSDDLFNDQKLQRVDLYVYSKDWALLKANFEDNTHYPADLRWNGLAARNASVRSRGSGSRSATKPGLLIDFGHYVGGQTFLGLKSLVLKNLAQDPSMVREFLAMKLHRRFSVAAPRESFALVYVNNAFMGLYGIVENIDTVATRRLFGEDTGYLFEYGWVTYYYFTYPGSDLQAYAPMFKPVTHATDPQSVLYGPLEAWTRTVNQAADEDFAAGLWGYLDIGVFIRHAAALGYLAELDGLLGNWAMNNFFLYRFTGKNLHQFIAWDEDHSLWGVDYPVTAGHAQNVLMSRIMAVPEFKDSYFATVKEVVAMADQVEGAGAVAGSLAAGPGWFETEATRAINMVRSAAYADTLKPWTNEEFEQDAARVLTFARQRGAFALCDVARLTGSTSNRPCSVPAGANAAR